MNESICVLLVSQAACNSFKTSCLQATPWSRNVVGHDLTIPGRRIHRSHMASPSAGDVIAIVTLVRDVLRTLSNTKGSVAEFAHLTDELGSLEDALLLAGKLPAIERKKQHSLRRVLGRCRFVIETFADDLDKYQPYLRDGGSGNRAKDMIKRIQFGLTKSEDISRFRWRLHQHLQSLQLIIHSAT